jgi:hypothetical protein
LTTRRAAALLILLCACGGGSPAAPPTTPPPTTTPPAADTLSVAAVTPAQGTVLILDDPISFNVTVSYALNSAASGRITLAVQDETGRTLQGGAQPSVAVTRGAAMGSISDRVSLPARGITRVDVILSLVPDGTTTPSARATVSYSVR